MALHCEIHMINIISYINFLFDKFRVEAVGADYNELIKLDGTEELQKFIFNGNIIIITSLFSFLGAFFFFSELFYNYQDSLKKTFLVLTFSSLWGLMIFNIDRAFISGMLGQTGTNRFFVALPRIILAIGIGYIIAHPLKMLFFDSILVAERSHKIEELVKEKSKDIEEEIQEYRLNRDNTLSSISSLTNSGHINSLISKKENEIKKANDAINKLELWSFYFVCYNGEVAVGYSEYVNGKKCPRGERKIKSEPFDVPDTSSTVYIKFPAAPGKGDYKKFKPEYNSYSFDKANQEHRAGRLQSNHFAIVLMRLWRDKQKKLEDELADLRVNILEKLTDVQKKEFSTLEYDQENFQSLVNAKVAQLNNIEEEIKSSYPDGYIYKTALLGGILNDYTSCFYSRNDCSVMETDESFKRSKYMFWIGMFITIIFISIEVAPILVKLMSSMGPYEKNISARQNRDDEKDRDSRIKKIAQEKEIQDIKNAAELLSFERSIAEKIAIDDIASNLMNKEINDAKSLDDLENLMARHRKINEHNTRNHS